MNARKYELPGTQYVYDGRQLVAAIEHRTDGWHVIIRNREIGVCADRVAALRLVHTHAESQPNVQT